MKQEAETTYSSMENSYRVILTSKGLNTTLGTTLIKEALKLQKRPFENESILLIIPEDFTVQKFLVEACKEIGFKEENIYLSGDFETLGERSISICYVTEGNTFEVLEYMRKRGLVKYVKECVRKGSTYIGSSAGALIAGKDICAAADFDTDFCGMKEHGALDLLDGMVVIPHYTFRQLKQYLRAFRWKEQYKEIKNVADNEVLIFDVVTDNGAQCIVKEKRIRMEEV